MSSDKEYLLSAQEVAKTLQPGFSHDFTERITKHLQIDVLVVDLKGDGYTLHAPHRSIILVKRTANWGRQNFSLAHELGHLFASKSGSVDSQSQHEWLANAFAAELLMPEDNLRNLITQQVRMGEIADYLWEAGVSTKALRIRLDKLGLTLSTDIRSALKLTTLKFLQRYWAHTPDRKAQISKRGRKASARYIPSRLLSDMERAVVSGSAPVESLAYLLDIPVAEVGIEPETSTHNSRDIEILKEFL